MNVSRIDNDLHDPAWPYQYCIRFHKFDYTMMYRIAEYARSRGLDYWVGLRTGVVYVPQARDVTLVQLQWQDL